MDFIKKRNKGMIHYFCFLMLLTSGASRTPRELIGDDECDDDIPSRPRLSPMFVEPPIPMCAEGEYHEFFMCRPCQDGTFMTQRMARERQHPTCAPCLERNESLHEVVVEPCTKTRDTKIMCEDGYYRSQVPGKPCQSECRRCDVCGLGSNMFKDHEVQECKDHQNTICCSEADMFVVDGACKKQPSTSPTSTAISTPKASYNLENSVLPNDEIKEGISRSCSAITIHLKCHFHLVPTVWIFILAKYATLP